MTDESKTPQTGSLSEVEIKKALLFDAAQHPATSLPLTLVIMSVIWLGLWSHKFDGDLWALILLIVSGVIAAGAFFRRYSVQFDEQYALKTKEVMALNQINPHELSQQGFMSRLVALIPIANKLTPAFRVLERIAIRYESVSRQITVIETLPSS